MRFILRPDGYDEQANFYIYNSHYKATFEAGIDRTYVSHLENGHKSPTVDVLFRICPVLGYGAIRAPRSGRTLSARPQEMTYAHWAAKSARKVRHP
jgi:hypothetical protein